MSIPSASEQAQNRHITGFDGPSPDVGKAYQFQPGVSGNPGGRPRRQPLREAIERALTAPNADAIIRALVASAKGKRPDVAAAAFLRHTGRPANAGCGIERPRRRSDRHRLAHARS